MPLHGLLIGFASWWTDTLKSTAILCSADRVTGTIHIELETELPENNLWALLSASILPLFIHNDPRSWWSSYFTQSLFYFDIEIPFLHLCPCVGLRVFCYVIGMAVCPLYWLNSYIQEYCGGARQDRGFPRVDCWHPLPLLQSQRPVIGQETRDCVTIFHLLPLHIGNCTQDDDVTKLTPSSLSWVRLYVLLLVFNILRTQLQIVSSAKTRD